MDTEVIIDGKRVRIIANLPEEEMDDTLLCDDEKTKDLSEELEKTREIIGEKYE